jgi:hypothetical protein
MTPDQLLTRMLNFANSPECPPENKVRLINGAYKTWADAITNIKYDYNELKKEAVNYFYEPVYFNSRQSKKNKRKLNFKKVINIKTQRIYNNVKEAADDSIYTTKLLSSFLNGTKKNNTEFMYLSQYENI